MRQLVNTNHSFPPDDVTVLIPAGEHQEISIAEKERRIRTGEHYGSLLSKEETPSSQWQENFKTLTRQEAKNIANYHQILTGLILRVPNPVLVSLARGGIPTGCLIKRDARQKGVDLPHYAISVIRGKHIDTQAIKNIHEIHPMSTMVFVDGWTGKGSIAQTLWNTLPTHIRGILAVISDPARVAQLYATRDDILLPSAMLNATVSGLLSRTFLSDDETHHVMTLRHLEHQDLTNFYLDTVCASFQNSPIYGSCEKPEPEYMPKKIRTLAEKYQVEDINLIKPSIGEAMRVFLRREPEQLLISEYTPDLTPLLHLANERGIPILIDPDLSHRAVCIIKSKHSPNGIQGEA